MTASSFGAAVLPTGPGAKARQGAITRLTGGAVSVSENLCQVQKSLFTKDVYVHSARLGVKRLFNVASWQKVQKNSL
ncbi:hypothetical protein CNY67_12585 [Desulfovibrio sp. G11]|nr:hypothetical protein CNY67_12585 [Desulfovibrio sp. G11]